MPHHSSFLCPETIIIVFIIDVKSFVDITSPLLRPITQAAELAKSEGSK